MPILASLLTSMFSGLVAFLTLYVTRKIAFGISAVAFMTGLTAALFVTMRATLLALNSHMVGLPEVWGMVLGISVPPAAPFCIASYFTIWTACTVYTWQRDLLHVLIKS